jgi:hypothetical protein
MQSSIGPQTGPPKGMRANRSVQAHSIALPQRDYNTCTVHVPMEAAERASGPLAAAGGLSATKAFRRSSTCVRCFAAAAPRPPGPPPPAASHQPKRLLQSRRLIQGVLARQAGKAARGGAARHRGGAGRLAPPQPAGRQLQGGRSGGRRAAVAAAFCRSERARSIGMGFGCHRRHACGAAADANWSQHPPPSNTLSRLNTSQHILQPPPPDPPRTSTCRSTTSWNPKSHGSPASPATTTPPTRARSSTGRTASGGARCRWAAGGSVCGWVGGWWGCRGGR